MADWKNCKKILCIRPDNMGDLLMSVPAMRALRESFGAEITVLISSMAAGIAAMIPEINDIIVYDLPWVKAEKTIAPGSVNEIVAELHSRTFDAAVIFTVYSQNPLPTVMLAWLAGIPRRLAYCRENPYELLTDWVPDREPYSEIKHQVRRDLDLVATVGAVAADERLSLTINEDLWPDLQEKISAAGADTRKPWLIMHPGVSEKKREYPADHWIQTGITLSSDYQLLITGGASETSLAEHLERSIGKNAFSLAGKLSLAEFVLLIKRSPLVISVNTGTIHLAAALDTPLIVLYALTNPQHFPWKATGKVLTYEVPESLKSRNQVIRYVDDRYFSEKTPMARPDEIIQAARQIVSGVKPPIPELPWP